MNLGELTKQVLAILTKKFGEQGRSGVFWSCLDPGSTTILVTCGAYRISCLRHEPTTILVTLPSDPHLELSISILQQEDGQAIARVYTPSDLRLITGWKTSDFPLDPEF